MFRVAAPIRRSAPIESVRLIGRPDRRSATEPAPCPYDFCDGSGFYKEAVPYGHANFGKLFPCQCKHLTADARRRERASRILASLGDDLGPELAGATLDTYRIDRAARADYRATMEAALTACRAYVEQPIGWLYLYGPVGVGKSHLMAAVGRELVQRYHYGASYASEPSIFSYLREGWSRQGKQPEVTTDERIAALQAVDVLMIDDLGTEPRGRDSTWVDGQILEILRPRFQYERITLITANLKVDDLDARISSRIKGRTNPDYTGREQCIVVKNADQRAGRSRR